MHGRCKLEDGNRRKINLFMKGSKYVSSIQVARTKGMDTRVSAPSSKAVAFDFAEVDIASGARLRQVQSVYITLSPHCSFSLSYSSFCNQYISFCSLT